MSTNDLPLLWTKWLARFRAMLSEEQYNLHFAEMELADYTPGESLVVRIANGENLPQLQRLYGGLLELAWTEAGGTELKVELTSLTEVKKAVPHSSPPSAEPIQTITGVGLDETHTFESFVEGQNSIFAVTAAKTVAQDSNDKRFNPLFIYGGVGLGKTHLLHAIGNQVKEERPHLSVRYIGASDFVDEFVLAMQERRMADMDRFYRKEVDLLLMDDVQFLQNKVETQNLLFNVFNELYHSNRQIVLSCDRPIAEVPGIHERLVSRFQWGLSVDIQPPDVETREAILRKKLRDHNFDCSDEVIRAIASQVGPNVRGLESVIRALLFHCTVYKRPVDLDMVGEVLRNTPTTSNRRITVEEVLNLVCEYFDVEKSRILEDGRGTKEVSTARQVTMYLLRKLAELSHKSIGQQLGNRDHSTVVYAVKTIEKQIAEDLTFRRSIDGLFTRLR